MNLPRVYISSQSWTPLPPPSPYHPSGLSQCTSPKHPVSCIEPKLAIHFLYDIIHVSMPFSQIIPPSPSPTESKSLFCTSVSLLLSLIQGYHYHLSKFHIYALVYCIGGEGNGTLLQYSGHLMWRVDSMEKTLMLGGIGGRRRRGRPRMRWLDGITDSIGRESEWTPGDGDEQGGLACCDWWGRKQSDTTERLNWTELKTVTYDWLSSFSTVSHSDLSVWSLVLTSFVLL